MSAILNLTKSGFLKFYSRQGLMCMRNLKTVGKWTAELLIKQIFVGFRGVQNASLKGGVPNFAKFGEDIGQSSIRKRWL